MATQSENAAIAVLQSQMKTVIDGVAATNSKLDMMTGIYVTQSEFGEFKKRWFLSHSLAGLSGAILTGVIIYILTHFGK